MNIYVVTTVYAPIRIIHKSYSFFMDTTTEEERSQIRETIIIDHRWPKPQIGAGVTQETYLKMMAASRNATLITPPINSGGHNGMNCALHWIKPKDDDIVFWIDPDTYPREKGWFTACLKALQNDPTLGSVSLMLEEIRYHRWIKPLPIQEPVVQYPQTPQMWDMTALRGSLLQKPIHTYTNFYGYVESEIYNRLAVQNLKHGYLRDYWQDVKLEPHDPSYVSWKAAHAFEGYKGNYDEWLTLRSPVEAESMVPPPSLL